MGFVMLKTRTIASLTWCVYDTGQLQGAYVPLFVDIEQTQLLCSAHAWSQDSATMHHNACTKDSNGATASDGCTLTVQYHALACSLIILLAVDVCLLTCHHVCSLKVCQCLSCISVMLNLVVCRFGAVWAWIS